MKQITALALLTLSLSAQGGELITNESVAKPFIVCVYLKSSQK